MERGTKIVLGGLAAVIAVAFVTIGPGRTLYEPAPAQAMTSPADDQSVADAATQPGYEPDPVVSVIKITGNRTGYSDPDPLAEDGQDAAPEPRIERLPTPVPAPVARRAPEAQAAAVDRRNQRGERSERPNRQSERPNRQSERRSERAAQAASGLDDGDISTVGDLAF